MPDTSAETKDQAAEPEAVEPEAAEPEAALAAGNGQARDSATRATFPVVAIGSSAGGVEALRELFDKLPTDGGMAVILSPHLAPDAPSLLGQLVQGKTHIPVVEVEDGVRLQTNRVFVMPPGMAMFLEKHPDGGPEVLKLREFELPRGHRKPIDDFFKSVAEAVGYRGVGIILSGTGSNGTAGLVAIKAAGGITVAQDPDTAKFRDMPVSAIRSGMVDQVLPPAEIPELLRRYASSEYGRDGGPADGVMIDGADAASLNRVLGVLQIRGGREFRPYKKPTLVRRIKRRMSLRRAETMADYVEVLRGDPEEVDQLNRDLLIHVTEFFRDPPAWDALREKVVDPLVARAHPRQEVRAWVPACSTGEEAYSLAIHLFEAAEAAEKPLTIRLFATDASPQALNIARRGAYPNGAMAAVSQARRERFFDEHDGMWRIDKWVRESIVFAPQDVLVDPPFSRIDVVTCRNLMIYLEPPAQARLLSLMHFALSEHGALFLGNAESTSQAADLYEPVDKRWRIYRRIGPPRHDLLDYAPAGRGTAVAEPAERLGGEGTTQQQRLHQYAQRALARRFAPPSVIADRAGRAIFFHGDTGPWLAQPAGEPTRDLFALARDPLGPRLRTLFRKALDGRRPAQSQIAMPDNGGDVGSGGRRMEVRVEPLEMPVLGEDLFLISFARVEPPPPAPDAEAGPDALAAAERERELRDVRDELQITIEQLETSNEELKAGNEEITSTNEELQSTNEELETSKEELQSLNEELNTVNSQLQDKVGELEETTDDLNNLLRSTDIATVFLDGELRIKRFTPAVRDLMEVIPADRGRPLANLAFKFDDDRLLDDARNVLQSLQPAEREVRAEGGKIFSRRVLPYRTQDNRIEGVVITFADITELRRRGAEAEAARAYAEMIVDTIREPLLVLEDDLTIRSANQAFYGSFHVEPRQTVGQRIFDLGNGQWDIPDLRRLLGDILPEQKVVDGYEVTHEFPRIGERTMRLHARQMDEHALILLAINDVTEAKRTEREREEHRLRADADALAAKQAQAANEAKDRFLATLSHELRTPLTPVLLSAEELARRDDLPEEILDSLRLVRDNVLLEARLIDDMLDLTRIARGKLRVDLRPADADELVQAAVRSTGGDHPRPDSPELHIELAADAHHVQCDPPRLQQVFWNLMSNALKFTPPDGVVTVATDNPDPDHWRLRIMDNGVGIDPTRLERIFDAFEQVEEFSPFRPQGLGLGLAITRTLVDLHGGTVTAASPGRGQGATFEVVLPTSDPAPEEPVAGAEPRPLRLLLVEDDPSTRMVITKLLRRSGHDVTAAATATAALEAAEGHPRFDVLLSDLGLPDFDGAELLRRLGDRRPPTALVLTGFGMEGDVSRCRDAGYDQHLIKPVEYDVLDAAIRRLTGRN